MTPATMCTPARQAHFQAVLFSTRCRVPYLTMTDHTLPENPGFAVVLLRTPRRRNCGRARHQACVDIVGDNHAVIDGT